MTRYHLVLQFSLPQSALTGAPVTAYLSTALLRDHVPPRLPYPLSPKQGFSERLPERTLLFTAFSWIYSVIIDKKGIFVNRKNAFSPPYARIESPAALGPSLPK